MCECGGYMELFRVFDEAFAAACVPCKYCKVFLIMIIDNLLQKLPNINLITLVHL